MRKFFLDRVKEESVLSGQSFMYLHYADMIANGYHRTMPCPFQSQGLLLNPNGDLHYCENSQKIGNVLDDSAESLYFKAENLMHRAADQGRDLPDLPEPVPGERRRDEAVRALREVPEARLPGEEGHDAAPGDAARTRWPVRLLRIARRRRPDGASFSTGPIPRRFSPPPPAPTGAGSLPRVGAGARRSHADGDAVDRAAGGARARLAAAARRRAARVLRQLVRQQLRAERRVRPLSRLRAVALRRAPRGIDGVGADGSRARRAVGRARRRRRAAVRARSTGARRAGR